MATAEEEGTLGDFVGSGTGKGLRDTTACIGEEQGTGSLGLWTPAAACKEPRPGVGLGCVRLGWAGARGREAAGAQGSRGVARTDAAGKKKIEREKGEQTVTSVLLKSWKYEYTKWKRKSKLKRTGRRSCFGDRGPLSPGPWPCTPLLCPATVPRRSSAQCDR